MQSKAKVDSCMYWTEIERNMTKAARKGAITWIENDQCTKGRIRIQCQLHKIT